MKRLERIPVPLLPCFVGALTLSNVYGGLGFSLLRQIVMCVAAIVAACYIVKMIVYPKTCLKEYRQVIPCSLYGGFSMTLMILGSFLNEIGFPAGRMLWFAGVAIHAAHILVFTVRNVILKRNIITFMPSWYVTYNGIMVACVSGGAMKAKSILTVITWYGIGVYLLILPFMLVRLLKVEIKPQMYHTQAVLLAPCSLCVVSYINVLGEANPAPWLLFLLYACVICSTLFIILKLPAFFSFPFTPGYAGITFPMAIGIVATQKMSAYLAGHGSQAAADVLTQIAGIQIFLTTMIIGYVLLRFLMMFLRTPERGDCHGN